MKLVHGRTITLSCMVGFENNLVQMTIMIKQCVINKNVVRSKVSRECVVNKKTCC